MGILQNRLDRIESKLQPDAASLSLEFCHVPAGVRPDDADAWIDAERARRGLDPNTMLVAFVKPQVAL